MRREYKLDNLRAIGIILVVMVHLISPIKGNFGSYALIYNLIILFSMPLLFFVSGYLSKIENSGLKAFKNILIPYIIFTIIWIGYCFIIQHTLGLKVGNIPETPFFYPTNILWYLLSLFIMRLLLPIFDKIKYMFIISIILAIVVGTTNVGQFLSISKTICLLPPFLMGYYLKNYREKIDSSLLSFKNKINGLISNRKIVFSIFVIVLIIISIFIYNIPSTIVRLGLSYHSTGTGNLIGMEIRLLIIVGSLILVLLINKLVTDRKGFMTKIGKNSLVIYVFHYYITSLEIDYIQNSSLSFIFEDFMLSTIFIIFNTIIIISLLSADFISKYVNNMIKWGVKITMKES